MILAVFLDIAYDSVNSEILPDELLATNLLVKLIGRIYGLLNDRTIFIKSMERFFGEGRTSRVITQASPLSTMLFHIYRYELATKDA